jgi:hypothetical protein
MQNPRTKAHLVDSIFVVVVSHGMRDVAVDAVHLFEIRQDECLASKPLDRG